MSRLDKNDVQTTILDMEKIIVDHEKNEGHVEAHQKGSCADVDMAVDVANLGGEVECCVSSFCSKETVNEKEHTNVTRSGTTEGRIGLSDPISTHPVCHISDEKMSDNVFLAHWRSGTPLVLSGVLKDSQVGWTPKFFTSNYGMERCEVVDCRSGVEEEINVGDFFSEFGSYGERTRVLKLKVRRVTF